MRRSEAGDKAMRRAVGDEGARVLPLVVITASGHATTPSSVCFQMRELVGPAVAEGGREIVDF